MDRCMSSYRPDVVVLQCGADSLSKDRLGHLNLSIKGHSQAVKHMLGYATPVILLGGGGYTIENVSRCWAYETAVCLGIEIENKLPENDTFWNAYAADGHIMHFPLLQRVNENTPEYLNSIVEKIT